MTDVEDDTPPVLIIALGPTGSGKGSIPSKISTLLKKEKKKEDEYEFTNILIDDLVENHKNYKQEVSKILEELQKNHEAGSDPFSINNLQNKDILKKFNNAYFQTRKKVDCNGEKISCDKLDDNNLTEALNGGKNIVFESTGEYFPSWLFKVYKNQLNKHKYEIIVSYSVVGLCELIKRNFTRTQETIKKFLEDKHNKAPRLPDMNHDKFKGKVKRIIKTFKETVDKQKNICTEQFTECAIRIVVFDNNTTDSSKMYDSKENIQDNDNDKVQKIINSYNANVERCERAVKGKSKKSKKSKKPKKSKKSKKSKKE